MNDWKTKQTNMDYCRFLDHAAIKHNPIEKQTKWQLSTLTDVEEVKIIIRMLPIWATTIMFWTVYAQMTTFSVSQATVMNRSITSSFSIPSGSLTVFFVASILLTIPFYDNVILPLLPRPLSSLQRIGVGLSLSCIAMAAAALIELKRLHSQIDHNKQLTVFWLIPQFFFVGSGEALAYVGQLDFFLRECPKGMKTMSTGLFLSTLSLGFFLSSGLVSVVNRATDWLANDLNEGRLDKFYWLLTALCLLNLGVYLVAAKWYVYKEGRAAATVEDDSVVGIELKEAEALYGA